MDQRVSYILLFAIAYSPVMEKKPDTAGSRRLTLNVGGVIILQVRLEIVWKINAEKQKYI
ncbi:MAG: hypothetical protein U9R56_03215 [candidate division Zixibacteria bacterium]|nr:hypothetical protein [candidate division Zixibacteria bacterium]